MKKLLNSELPYYAVIFISKKYFNDDGYSEMAKRMEALSASEPGFLGIQSVRGEDGLGITVSYWKSLEDIRKWKSHLDHRDAQAKGKSDWYQGYQVRICKVERQYEFGEI
jgi:heme-degrading monooxygenase HmoA